MSNLGMQGIGLTKHDPWTEVDIWETRKPLPTQFLRPTISHKFPQKIWGVTLYPWLKCRNYPYVPRIKFALVLLLPLSYWIFYQVQLHPKELPSKVSLTLRNAWCWIPLDTASTFSVPHCTLSVCFTGGRRLAGLNYKSCHIEFPKLLQNLNTPL